MKEDDLTDRVAKDEKGPVEGVPEAAEPKTMHTSDTRDHLVGLDALRGIAIWAVVMHHLLSRWRGSVGPVEVPFLGWDAVEALHFMPGVPLFYLLSGYLLTWTEGKRAERGNYSLRSYAMRRVLRLVPAYYVAIVVVLLVWPKPTSFWDLVSHLTFTHGFTPAYARTMSPAFWSLTPEVVFYAMVPLLVLKLTRLWQRLALFVVLFLVALPTRLLVLENAGLRDENTYGVFNPFQFYASFPTTLLYLFVAGVLMRVMVEKLNERERPPRWQPYVAFALFVPSALWIVTTPGLGFLRLESLGQTFVWIQSLLIQDVTLFAFFAAALLGAPILRTLLGWKPLAFLGLISYSMFVFHQTVLLLVNSYILRTDAVQDWVAQGELNLWIGFVGFIVGIFAISGVISYLGYRYIESPFLRIKPK